MTEEFQNHTEEPHKNAETKRGRPFEKGQGGRTKGSQNQTTRMLQRLMEADAETIVNTVIDGAKKGDWVAAKIVIDRLVAPRRDNLVKLNIPTVKTLDDVATAMGVVVEAVANAEISPSEGSAVNGLLQSYSQALEVSDLARRIEALEARDMK
jgi:hypothetical protein